MTAVVELIDVSKVFSTGERETRAADGISLSIEEGEFIILLGPSGSGKTTVLNLLSGLDAPSSGTVLIDGKDISAMSDDERTKLRAQEVGFVFQFFNLFPALTAIENVELGVALNEPDLQEVRQRAMKALQQVGLEGMEDKFPNQLSGGEQQRVAVARGLAMQPRILVADEPTGNLDHETSQVIWKLLRRLNKETGTTIICVTHWVDASTQADRTIHLRSGKIHRIEVTKAKGG